MLESGLNQAAGLHALAARPVMKMIAVASHGDQASELPLLWEMCRALTYIDPQPVLVLDGTTNETAQNPGLAQLMDDPCQAFDCQVGQGAWAVLPARLGLQKLCTRQGSQMSGLDVRVLESAFQHLGVVVVYGDADLLVALMPDGGAEPLLAVSASNASRVSAYQTIKRLWLKAGLRPTVATLVHEPIQTAMATARALCRNLQDCSMYFLGYPLDTSTVAENPARQDPSPDMYRLTLRLLERAMPLQRNAPLISGLRTVPIPVNMERSH